MCPVGMNSQKKRKHSIAEDLEKLRIRLFCGKNYFQGVIFGDFERQCF